MRRAATALILTALTLVASESALGEQSAGDRLCGWYKLTTGNRLIPVFKVEGTYYTVMSRFGFEIALKECPDGLQWPSTPPSSLVGTKIGFDEESDEIYLSLVDQNREHQDEHFTSGEKQSLTPIAKPSWLRDVTAQPPHTHDDFLGWYEPLWCPYVRVQVRREGQKYLLEFQIIQTDGDKNSWVPHGKQYELTSLPEGLGFAMRPGDDEDVTFCLLYSATRKRFEFQVGSVEAESQVLRNPLARIASFSQEQGAAVLPPMDIGIHAWE